MQAATELLLGEKEPSLQFTTPEELGELGCVFLLCCWQQHSRRRLEHGRRLGCTVKNQGL
jgi:hypothetical protein